MSKDSIHLDLVNTFYGPVQVIFTPKIPSIEELRMPDKIIIGARDTLTQVVSLPKSLISDTASFEWKVYFTTDATLGDPDNSKHDVDAIYSLPYPKGKSYEVLQGWNGRFSHRSRDSKYAVDFRMPVGDTVCTAREGIVVRTEDSYSENGGPEYRDRANQVVILHDDGTLGFYVHLDYLGVHVGPGDHVVAGQPIGLSGNTGYSTKPHLHFVVREAPDKAIPVYFKGYENKRLIKNRKYARRR